MEFPRDIRMTGYIFVIWYFLVNLTSYCHSYNKFETKFEISKCSWEYGAQPCPKYVPAPPGKTPTCARPGLTYCEHPENYPSQLIYHLVQKWQFDHLNLIIDESKDEFHALVSHPHDVYGPPQAPSIVAQNTVVSVQQADGYHYEKPKGPGLSYPTISQNFSVSPTNPFLKGYHTPIYPAGTSGGSYFQTYKYTANIPSTQQEATNFGPAGGSQSGFYPDASYQAIPATAAAQGYYNDVWKRSERYNKTIRRRRALQLREKYSDFPKVTSDTDSTTFLHRKRRQTSVQGQTLCRSRTNFVTPRAALNSKGNWMYVVNMPEFDNRYTQQVKSETCIDKVCSNLCGLPQGYASKCEQKYVQKRLVALEGGGGDLYTDTFWFPSCCICTISNSNT